MLVWDPEDLLPALGELPRVGTGEEQHITLLPVPGHVLRMDESRGELALHSHGGLFACQRVNPFTMSQVPCPGWLEASVRLPAPQSPAPSASPAP